MSRARTGGTVTTQKTCKARNNNPHDDNHTRFTDDTKASGIVRRGGKYRKDLNISRTSQKTVPSPYGFSVAPDPDAYSTGISRITPIFREVIPSFHRQGNGIPAHTVRGLDRRPAEAESLHLVDAEARVLDDTFAVQDEITKKIVTALDVNLVAGEQARVWHKTLRDPKALELYYRGLDHMMRMDKESMSASRQFFESVAHMAPKVALGPTFIAFTHWMDAVRGWGESAEASLDSAGEWAEKAAALEDADGQGHIILAHVHLMNRRHDEALRVAEEAVHIRHSCANTNALYGNILLYCGRPREAIGRIKNGIRFSPVYPPLWVDILAAAYRDSEQYGLAISAAKEALRLNPGDRDGQIVLASACAMSGWMEVAREIAGSLLETDPGFTLSAYATTQPYADPETLAKIVVELRTAGLPD